MGVEHTRSAVAGLVVQKTIAACKGLDGQMLAVGKGRMVQMSMLEDEMRTLLGEVGEDIATSLECGEEFAVGS